MRDILYVLMKEFPDIDKYGSLTGEMTLHNWHSRDILRELGKEITPSNESSMSRTMKRLQKEGLISSRYRNFTHGKVFEITDKGIEFKC